MDQNRIRKLLSSEYEDFYEKIIIESPFAETTRDGRGVREVTLALSSSKLIIASDVFRKNPGFVCLPAVDPSIECFELISVYPLEFINLSVFRRRRRKTLKARLINGRITYYELGGIYHRKSLWALWCTQIEVLQLQKENSSSLSETTAASSSSSTTLYLLSSDGDSPTQRQNPGNPRVCRFWAHHGGGDGPSPSWPRKDIYLGPTYNELGHGLYAPVPIRFAGASFDDLKVQYELRPVILENPHQKSNHSWPPSKPTKTHRRSQKEQNMDRCNILYVHRDLSTRSKSIPGNSHSMSFPPSNEGYENYGDFYGSDLRTSSSAAHHEQSNHALVPKLSRFGFGIHENCSSGLYLAPHEGDPDHLVKIRPAYKLMDPYKLIESGVLIWERARTVKSSSSTSLRSLRRYGLATCPHFLFGLGPWSVHPGDKISVQKRRSSSLVTLRRHPADIEMRLPVSKKQLCASVSMTSLEPEISSSATTTRGRIVIFWTPDYWYRPRAATTVYRELRDHLTCLHNFQSEKQKCKRSFFLRRKFSSDSSRMEGMKMCSKSSCILNKIFSGRDMRNKRKDVNKSEEERTVSQLRKLLKPNFRTTIWDLDSTTLAKQLTLIDRDLFLRIPVSEVEIVVFQKSSRNAPNIGAWVAFSHRISSLTSSEILMIRKLDMRSRMLARFINSANKCFSMGNFNSSRSIIAGLQSPSVYRLRATWNYLKTHHAMRYETFTRLCRIFKNCRTDVYFNSWEKAESRPPVLPYIGHVLVRILGLDADGEVIREETPRRWTEKNFDCGCTYLYQASEGGKSGKKNPPITRHTISSVEKQSEQCLVRQILSTTIGRIIHGRSPATSQMKFNVHWAAKRLMIARKFFDRWQTRVLTSRIIREHEMKNMNIDWRRKRVQEVGVWLSDCQKLAREYDFPGHSLAWEFLLKARYKEDRENFRISLKLEPPLG